MHFHKHAMRSQGRFHAGRGPMGHPGSGHRSGMGRGGGRRRQFDSNGLKLILLRLLADQPRHGYDLIREIEERSGGAYVPSPGVIYPTLTLLSDMGHIEEQNMDGARKQFAITTAGAEHLAQNKDEAEALLARLAALGEQRARTEDGPIRRAMTNLRTVLQDQLSGTELDDRIHDIAAILDEAAQKIERLK